VVWEDGGSGEGGSLVMATFGGGLRKSEGRVLDGGKCSRLELPRLSGIGGSLSRSWIND
jgi:hypothetical protein